MSGELGPDRGKGGILREDQQPSARVRAERAAGARPDSPGVDRDMPRGDETVGVDVWAKRLFVGDGGSTILHVRRQDSPWGRYTVWFRDCRRSYPRSP